MESIERQCRPFDKEWNELREELEDGGSFGRMLGQRGEGGEGERPQRERIGESVVSRA